MKLNGIFVLILYGITGVRLLGIGRNQYIDIMNTYRAKVNIMNSEKYICRLYFNILGTCLHKYTHMNTYARMYTHTHT